MLSRRDGDDLGSLTVRVARESKYELSLLREVTDKALGWELEVAALISTCKLGFVARNSEKVGGGGGREDPATGIRVLSPKDDGDEGTSACRGKVRTTGEGGDGDGGDGDEARGCDSCDRY